MEIQQTLKQYRHIIVLGGIATGAICAVDLFQITNLGLFDYPEYFHWAILAILALAGWTYYSTYMNKPPERRRDRKDPLASGIDGLKQITPQDDIELGGN